MTLPIFVWYIIILTGMFIVLEFAVAIYWMLKHHYAVTINENNDGVLLAKHGRYRLVNRGKQLKPAFFPIYCLWWRFGQPLAVDIDDAKDKFMAVESNPIWGVDKKLRVHKVVNVNGVEIMTPWFPDKQFEAKSTISDIRMAWLHSKTEKLYESTKIVNKMELMRTIVVPMGLIMLAVIMILFFPDIYEKIMGQAAGQFTDSSAGWLDAIKERVPLG